jgi:biotin synthase
MDESFQRGPAKVGCTLSKEELVALLDEEDPKKVSGLYRKADRIRKEFMGDEVQIRGIDEFSN